ncbi:MAG TPA: SHOCT domain-containing protein [Acidimicrobiales bacterium]|nr:SHOCT domain-containing protein [Acidimicrobiales bacterium]
MPGLIRGVARTAAIAGTATAVSNRVSRRQGNRWAAQEQQAYAPQPYAPPAYEPAPYAPPAYETPAPVASDAPTSGTDRIAALRELADLKAQGVLTQAEFEAEKARLLASS